MEDFSDSISEDEKAELDSLKEEIEKKDAEIVELKRKYKERFLDSAKTEEKQHGKEILLYDIRSSL